MNVIYCKDGSRHVVEKSNNRNKLLKDTAKLLDGSKQKTSTKTYTCTFESSFLMGICNGKQYFYDEELSSIKRKDLSSFYRFVKKSQSDMVSDTCERFKGESKKLIKCNDIGLVLEFGGS